ncbi:hypothetical protein N7497_004247 [Penicillium chrysogenum]|nr:hypothetical protein N7497_004247 [Penicillium chrysogenum]
MSAKNGRGGADFGDAGVAWNSYGWAVVQVEPEPDEAGMSMPDSFTFTLSPRMSSIEAMFSHFFQTVPGKGPPVGATAHRPKSAPRFHLAAVDSRGAFARAAVRARNPVELLARLEYAAGAELTPEPGLDNMFDLQTAEALTGVAPGLLRRHPTLRDLVARHYEALVNHTIYSLGRRRQRC